MWNRGWIAVGRWIVRRRILEVERVEEALAAVVVVAADAVELAVGCNNSECATVDTTFDLQSAAADVVVVEGASVAASN